MARYDDVNMDSDVSGISMTINNGVFKQLLSIQQLPTQSRFNSHRSRVRPKRQRLPSNVLIENASDQDSAPPQNRAPRRFRSRLAANRPKFHGAGTSPAQKARASMQRGWELWALDIKALDQAVFDSKHVTDHLFR